MSRPVARRLLTVEEYHKMAEAGILKERGLELINGEIVKMSPIGSYHASIVERLKDVLTVNLYKKAIVRVQNPILLSRYSEPEPDVAIVKYREDYYRDAHPSPIEVMIVIEVADSSLEHDVKVKLPLYAKHQIPEYWLIKLEEQEVEVYSNPERGVYKLKKLYDTRDVLEITSFQIQIPLAEIFQ